MDDDRSGDLD